MQQGQGALPIWSITHVRYGQLLLRVFEFDLVSICSIITLLVDLILYSQIAIRESLGLMMMIILSYLQRGMWQNGRSWPTIIGSSSCSLFSQVLLKFFYHELILSVSKLAGSFQLMSDLHVTVASQDVEVLLMTQKPKNSRQIFMLLPVS